METERRAELGLGTVQLGQPYGISNTVGQTPRPEARRILEMARARGLRYFDTAPSYGESEAILGECLPPDPAERLVTKMPALRPDQTSGRTEELGSLFADSLARLRRTAVYALLFHHPADLLGAQGPRLYEKARKLVDTGKVKKIGISIYEEREIDALLARYPLDLVQLPLNVFDQRLLAGNTLGRLKDKGVEIHARSLFLQGLLLMDPEQIPPSLEAAREPVARFRESVLAEGRSPLQACLAFALGVPEVDVAVCGVNTAAQLRELLAATEKAGVSRTDWGGFASNDSRLVNPSLWGKP